MRRSEGWILLYPIVNRRRLGTSAHLALLAGKREMKYLFVDRTLKVYKGFSKAELMRNSKSAGCSSSPLASEVQKDSIEHLAKKINRYREKIMTMTVSGPTKRVFYPINRHLTLPASRPWILS